MRADRRGILLVLVACTCFGTLGIFSSLFYDDGGDPWTLLFLRFAVTGPALALLGAVGQFDRADGWWLPGCWLVGGLAVAIFLGRFWFDITDSSFQRARAHAAPEVA